MDLVARAVGLRGPKVEGAGAAWAPAASAAADLAVVEAAGAAVDLAVGGNVGEILFAKRNEIQLWRKSNVVRCAVPKKVRCSHGNVRGNVLGGLLACLLR